VICEIYLMTERRKEDKMAGWASARSSTYVHLRHACWIDVNSLTSADVQSRPPPDLIDLNCLECRCCK
jgi:hypothetical protein